MSLRAFRAGSADALAALTGELDSSLGQGADAATLGRELFSAAQVLRSEPGLRRIVTDGSVPAEAKQALAHQVFDGKVDPATADLVASAVSRRWTTVRDLADGLERLSEVAHVRSAGDDADRLADELFTFGAAVDDNPELRDALSNPVRSIDDKTALVISLLDGKALPATVALARQSLAGTYRTVDAALATYQKVAAEARDQGVATVRVARPLSDADRARLEAALKQEYGRDVHLNVLVDPEILGGIKVEIGDDVIDGTMASRLAGAQRKLAG